MRKGGIDMEFLGNLKKHGERTRIGYEIKNPCYMIALILPFAAAVLMFFAFLDFNYDLSVDIHSGFEFRLIILAVIFIGVIPALIILITGVYHERILIRFVKSIFNIR
jgi:hypothetical protein